MKIKTVLNTVDRIKGAYGSWAFFFAFIAITAVELSYVLGGLNWLDPVALLLIPAFILLIIQIVSVCNAETKNYCVAFTILIACLLFSFFHLSGIEIGTVGDQYHISKAVAFSIKNSFFTQLQYGALDPQFYISDFIESLWGVFWRWTQGDFSIVLLQALPIILLWQQLTRFFEHQKIKAFQGILATVVVLTLEILWAQQGSPFIDSIVGIFIGINLLLCYTCLSPPYERRFSNLAGLAFVSGLCIISKPTGLCVGVLGLTIALVLGFRYFSTLREKILLPMIALPSLVYFLYHQIQVFNQNGSFFYPFVNFNNPSRVIDVTYPQLYDPLMFGAWIKEYAFNFKPLYVLSSWLSDYKMDSYITPAPYIRGNGLVFTYFVLPTLVLWLFQHKNIIKNKWWKDPRLSIFAAIFIYYYSFEGSIDVRFALGYNIFILSWCLSYLFLCLQEWGLKWFKALPTIIICLLLVMSVGSYCDGIRGKRFEPHLISPFAIQKEIFPHLYSPDIRKYLIQKLLQEHPM